MREKEINMEMVPGGWVSTPRPAQKTGTWRTLRPVVEVEKCIGCGICEGFCPEAAIKVVDGKAEVDYDYCKGCGVCANECTSQAIAMELEVEEEPEGGGS